MVNTSAGGGNKNAANKIHVNFDQNSFHSPTKCLPVLLFPLSLSLSFPSLLKALPVYSCPFQFHIRHSSLLPLKAHTSYTYQPTYTLAVNHPRVVSSECSNRVRKRHPTHPGPSVLPSFRLLNQPGHSLLGHLFL